MPTRKGAWISPKARAAAAKLVAVRAQHVTEFTNPLDFLFEEQLAVIYSGARTLAMLCSRRAGKTVLAGGKLILTAFEKPGALCVYMALSRESARDIMWPELKLWVERVGLPSDCVDEARMRINLPNGSTIICTGTDDIRTIKRWRGVKIAIAIIDECGAQDDDVLTTIIRDILRAALIDYKGELWLLGTPGEVERGYWFNITGPERKSKIALFHWTAFNNPHLPHYAEELLLILEEEGWVAPKDFYEKMGLPVPVDDNGEELPPTPTFVREYLGRWYSDNSSRVYPFSPSRNLIEAMPTHNKKGAPLDPDKWKFVIAIDVGYIDEMALSILAAHPDDARDFVILAEKHKEMLVKELAERIKKLWELYGRIPVVIDSGGMGRYHRGDLEKEHGIRAIPAEKEKKASFIRQVRERLMSGLIVFVKASTVPLQQECEKVPWDKNKLLPKPGVADHSCDTLLYGWRFIHYFNNEDASVILIPGTPNWYAEVQKVSAQQMIDKAHELRNRPKANTILSRILS